MSEKESYIGIKRMKFDLIIMNPPIHRYSKHERIIKNIRKYTKKLVVIIPSKDGNIESSLCNCNSFKFKIYVLNENEKLKLDKFTMFPQSELYINVPDTTVGLKRFFETGEYKYKIKLYGKYEYNIFYTFSFNNKQDLETFKKRLYEKNWVKYRGIFTPNYEDILNGIDYIKKYKEI
jgi:hypothetical protein